MSDTSTNIFNSTQETVKICLLDTKNNETTAIITAGEIWSRKTESGWNTIVIIPLNDNQDTFSYTLQSNRSLIVKRKLEKLILVPSSVQSPKLEAALTLSGHICYRETGHGNWYNPYAPCRNMECMIFNESNEPIRICVTDVNDRNTHVILEHGEHNIVKTPTTSSIMQRLFSRPENCAPLVKVSVLDFNLNNVQPTLIARAKDSICSHIHDFERQSFKFLRVIKKDGYFTTEHDTIKPYYAYQMDIPFNYQLSKECCQKVQSIRGSWEIKKVSENKYDVIPVQNDCSIL